MNGFNGAPTDPKLREAAYWLHATAPANGADPLAQLGLIARHLIQRMRLSEANAMKLYEEYYEPRLLSPLPDHAFPDAICEASEQLDQTFRSVVGAWSNERPVAARALTPAPATAQGRSGYAQRFKFINSTELTTGDFRPDWLVKDAVVKGQPGFIAGPSKALKTNLAIDLAVSLATGTPFLGKFAVPSQKRVGVISGESGAATIQETFRRVCRAKSVAPELGNTLCWCFDLPTLSDVGAVTDIVTNLCDYGADLAILDPLYLMLGDIDVKNMFESGPLLKVIVEQFVKVGITPLIIHHANKQIPAGQPMELEHLAFSGPTQFAGQWLLLNRRTPYKDDGQHDLWLRVGGRLGFGGLWNLQVDEGLVDEEFKGRKWDVSLLSLNEAKATLASQKVAERQKAQDDKREADRNAVLHAIDVEKEAGRNGATKTIISVRSGIAISRVQLVLDELIEFGHIQPVRFEKVTGNCAKQMFDGYRRASPKTDNPAPPPTPDLPTTLDEPPSKPAKRARKGKKKCSGQVNGNQKRNGSQKGATTVPDYRSPDDGNDGSQATP